MTSDLDRIRHLGYGERDLSVLTDGDIAGLIVIEDNTDRVIEELGIALGRALEAVGIEAESDAARLCPVDTGRLRNSITHTIEGGSSPAAIIGTNVEYSAYVHNGVHGRPGQPFLTDAVNQNLGRYRQIFKEAMEGA